MDIGEVAKLSGVKPSTLRFYEEKGLIKSIGRNGLRRTYNPSVLESLALISLGSQSGFSLEEISKMFSTDGKIKIDKKRLQIKAMEIEQTIKKLQTLKKGLLHAAKCPAKHHSECPTFSRLLNVARKKQIKKAVKG